jgi:hypothetical protein
MFTDNDTDDTPKADRRISTGLPGVDAYLNHPRHGSLLVAAADTTLAEIFTARIAAHNARLGRRVYAGGLRYPFDLIEQADGKTSPDSLLIDRIEPVGEEAIASVVGRAGTFQYPVEFAAFGRVSHFASIAGGPEGFPDAIEAAGLAMWHTGRRLGIPVVLTARIATPPPHRTARLEDLGDYYPLAYPVDTVLFIEPADSGVVHLQIAKDRNGVRARIAAEYHPETRDFTCPTPSTQGTRS